MESCLYGFVIIFIFKEHQIEYIHVSIVPKRERVVNFKDYYYLLDKSIFQTEKINSSSYELYIEISLKYMTFCFSPEHKD